MADDRAALPANWYGRTPLTWAGLNYLGKPVSVPVEGASPTGTPAGGAAAIASGAAGPTGGGRPPAGAAPAAPHTPSWLQPLSYGLQGVQLADLLSGLRTSPAGGSASDLVTSRPNAPMPAGEAPGAADAFQSLETPVGMMETPAGAAAAGAGAAEEGASAIGAGAALAGGALLASAEGELGGRALHGLFGQNTRGQSLAETLMMINPMTTPLAFPSFFGDLVSGHLFSGPPAGPFPSSTYQQLSGAVAKALPSRLTVPPNATPEQRQAIESANAVIDQISPYANPHVLPDAFSPSHGPQSAQTWNISMGNVTRDLTNQFGRLQTLYPQAQQAIAAATQAAQESALAGKQLRPGEFYRGKELVTT